MKNENENEKFIDLLWYKNVGDPLQSRRKEHLKRLPCQISAIKFASNSIAVCVPEEGSHEIRFDFFVLVFKFGNSKTVKIT